jgi:hypothetical protein
MALVGSFAFTAGVGALSMRPAVFSTGVSAWVGSSPRSIGGSSASASLATSMAASTTAVVVVDIRSLCIVNLILQQLHLSHHGLHLGHEGCACLGRIGHFGGLIGK